MASPTAHRRQVLPTCATHVVDRAPIGDRGQPPAEVADLLSVLARPLVQRVPRGVVRGLEVRGVGVQAVHGELAANGRENLWLEALVALGDDSLETIVREEAHRGLCRSDGRHLRTEASGPASLRRWRTRAARSAMAYPGPLRSHRHERVVARTPWPNRVRPRACNRTRARMGRRRTRKDRSGGWAARARRGGAGGARTV